MTGQPPPAPEGLSYGAKATLSLYAAAVLTALVPVAARATEGVLAYVGCLIMGLLALHFAAQAPLYALMAKGAVFVHGPGCGHDEDDL